MMKEQKPRSAEQATCSAKAELAEADVRKALECCIRQECMPCPNKERRTGITECMECLMKDALAILREKDEIIEAAIAGQKTLQKSLAEKDAEIERLRKAKYIYSTVDYCADDLVKAQEEIERLKQENKDLHDNTDVIIEMVTIARAEAITEFAERVKASLNDVARWQMHGVEGEYFIIGKSLIDKIAKEMKGESATHGE